ncbi:F0F1 ATP synthase subunit delta [Pseudactinotalea sp.]|uniref:F0F1 ATP synthase subunit delta n=1 Tax=Pseudactinotalea sp. TaxID=1926260 RepID=UPI003B3AC337
MRATSQASLGTAASSWEPVLQQAGAEAATYGEQLFAVVDALDSSAGLRRALTEPTRDGADKAAVVTQLLGGKVDDAVVDLLSGMVRSRWSADADLADSIDELGVVSYLAAAESKGALTQLEEDTFRLTRVLAENRDLRFALGDRDATAERRVQLLGSVFAGKVSEETLALVTRSVRSLRSRTLTASLARIGELAARRRRQLVAVVTAAAPLSQAQQDRLAASLAAAYGREVQLNIAVDPAVTGGFRIQVGDEVVDATIAGRLDHARRRLAG